MAENEVGAMWDQYDKIVLEDLETYKKTGVVSTRLMMEASLAYYYYFEHPEAQKRQKKPPLGKEDTEEIQSITDRVHALAEVFEGAVWYLGGLQAKVNACPIKGMSGKGEGWSALIYCMAGRCMLTLTDDKTKQSLTLITADDEEPFNRYRWGNKSMGPMGVQGMDCTWDVANKLLTQAIKSFPEVKPEENVFIG